MGNDKDRFMTVTEVRQMLRLSKRTVYNLLETGVIPGVQLGRDWRIDRSQLEEKLKQK